MARSKKKASSKARKRSTATRGKKKPRKPKRHPVRRPQPKPLQQLSIGSPEFAKLQAKWYGKLADEGFEDIEWTDNKTGLGQGTPYLSGSGYGKVYKPETELYFRMVQNYITHNEKSFDKWKRFILSLHVDGVSYRDIVRAYNKRFRARRSLFFIFYKLRQYKTEITQWNEVNKEGLLNEAAADVYVNSNAY